MDIKRNNLDLNDIAYQRSGWTAPRFCDRIMQGGVEIWNSGGLTSTVKQTIYADYPSDPSLAATIWTALKAYARQHSALVSYINNDPDLYCSLPLDGVTGRKVRWITTTGTAYFDTGVKVNPSDYFKFKFKCDNLPSSGYNRVTPYGCSDKCWMRIERVNYIECCLSAQSNIGNCTFAANTAYEMQIFTSGTYKIGSATYSKAALTAQTTTNLHLFKKAESYNESYTKRMDRFEMYDSTNTPRLYFVPYKPSASATSMELLDLVATEAQGTAVLATRVGTFTELKE